MGILTQLLWTSTEQFLETPPPPPPVSPTPSQPLRKFSPKLVVKGEVRAPLSPDPFQWKVVGQSSKVSRFFLLYYVCLHVFVHLLVNGFTVVTKKHLYNQMCDVLFQSQVPSQASVAQQQVRDFSFF